MSTTVIAILLIILFLGSLLFNIVLDTEKADTQKNLIDEFKKLENFEVSQAMISNDLKNGLAIDNRKNKFCILKNNEGNIHTTIYSYKDLLESEILEDGHGFTKTSRGSQVGGILIGGLVLGGVGAVIGGLSGKKNNIEKINSIDLKIIVNDTNSPMTIFNFFKSKEGEEKSSSKYKLNIQEAREWNSLLSVLIKKADEDDNKKSSLYVEETISNNKSTSIADEILKLKALKDDGLITDDEFISQKNKILNS